jgi:2,4-dienoyl-CoA reductase-like NADH-dependent reductase (Old Yellow Enzyme family)
MTKYFTYRSAEELAADIEARGLDIRLAETPRKLLEPLAVGHRQARNRLAVHPMEGCDGTLDGRPGELTYRRWERFGAGGAAIVWGEATAVAPEGRANPRQLLLTRETAGDFARLLETARKAHRSRFGRDDGLLVGLQLTHSGRWSYPRPLIARRSRPLDAVKGLPPDYPLVDDAYLERLEERYEEAACLAAQAGFDFVDIKQCHTYLLNELLAARDREGPYGGGFDGRTRFLRNVAGRIRARAGPGLLLASRINVYDGPVYRGAPGTPGEPVPDAAAPGFGVSAADGVSPDPEEPLRLVALLEELGFALVNVSMGSPYFNPHIGRPFERPPVDGYEPPEHPLAGVERHFRLTALVQRRFPGLAVLGTGYSWLRHYAAAASEANAADGKVSVMGLGRGALAYPDFAADLMEHGRMADRKACIGVSYCTALMRAKNNELGQFPAGCVPRDPIYAGYFKAAQAAR